MARLRARGRALLIRNWPTRASRLARLSRAETGAVGEELAARWLRAQGFRLLGRRVRTPLCEVDILAEVGGAKLVVEVKATLGERGVEAHWQPSDRMSWQQEERLQKAAAWLARGVEQGQRAGGRVDLVEVWLGGPGAKPELLHHPNWSSGEV